MKGFPQSMNTLVREFSKMPGIGPRTAQRLAFFVLKGSDRDAKNLARLVRGLKLKETKVHA